MFFIQCVYKIAGFRGRLSLFPTKESKTTEKHSKSQSQYDAAFNFTTSNWEMSVQILIYYFSRSRAAILSPLAQFWQNGQHRRTWSFNFTSTRWKSNCDRKWPSFIKTTSASQLWCEYFNFGQWRRPRSKPRWFKYKYRKLDFYESDLPAMAGKYFMPSSIIFLMYCKDIND